MISCMQASEEISLETGKTEERYIQMLTARHLPPIPASHCQQSLPHIGTSILGSDRCSWKSERKQLAILEDLEMVGLEA